MPEEWASYVGEYHDANPGITEEVLADARDGAGRSPYDWLLEAVPAGATTVVDLACGSGPLARRLPGARVVGVDQSAGELARAAGLRAQARAPALPLAGGCAGAVVTSMALMLMNPLEAVLAEVARIMQTGGTFVATVPSRGEAGSAPLFADLLRTLGQTGVTYPEPLDDGALAGRFAAAGLTLSKDETAVFVRAVPRPEDAEQVVRAFYAPGAGPQQIAAAVEKLREAAPVDVAYRIRRLVASRETLDVVPTSTVGGDSLGGNDDRRSHDPSRPMTALAIEATGLVKSFGETRAVDGVDLAVRRGSVYGVLGPNGAGKTTTIRMLATLLRPDAGSARVLGHDVVAEADAVRALVSLTGQLASVDEDLTGMENLILLGRLLGLKHGAAKGRAGELLDAFGLVEAAGKLVKHFSGGMRRRLDIAASIVVTPEVMFLDEPTTGLDPRSRNQVWDIIRALVEEGTTILLCTQYLEEADQLAEGIAVIDHGKVIAEGTPGQLKASVGSTTLRVRLLDPAQRPAAEEVLDRALGGVTREADPAALSAACPDADRGAEVVAALVESGVRIAAFSLGQPTLDEVFLALTGHPAEEEPGIQSDAISEENPA